MQTLNVAPLSGSDLAMAVTILAPIVAVVAAGAVVLVIDLFPADWVSRRPLMWVASLGVLIAAGYDLWLWAAGWVGTRAFGGFYVFDGMTLFFQLLFLLAALLVLLSSTTFANRAETIEAEFYVTILFSTSGLMVMAGANELMSIYLGLELSSLALAFLAAWNKRDTIAQQGLKSTEAGMKFFLLSAMSTAILLFGMALLYGVSGATTLADVSRSLTATPSPALLLSITMLVAGFGFKIAAAPFQLWTPDVYQGAPTPATAFFSVASKSAGFAVILRVFLGALPSLSPQWAGLFGVLAFVTMTVGNLMALNQSNIKRLMAYSSITHVGYVLIGLAAASMLGLSAILYYLLAYTFTNLAAFIVISVMASYAPDDEISGYAGLARRSPAMGLALTAALLSLAGIPPFVGFFSKLYLFLAAIQTGDRGLQFLVIWALVMSAVSLFYYGRVIHTMWMREGTETGQIRPAFSEGLALATSVAGIVVVGLVAQPFLDAAQQAASMIVAR